MAGFTQMAAKTAKLTGVIGLAGTLLATAAPWASASATAGPPLAAGRYTTIKVPGGKNVTAEGISDSGTIVGCDQQKAGGRGFIERNKKFTTLADPAAGAKGFTCAFSINSLGVIVGNYGTSVFHGFVFKGTRFATINDPHAGHKVGQGTAAVDINDSGTIVGWYLTSKNAELGFMLKRGKFTSINFPGHANATNRHTTLNGISDNGTMTGIFGYGAGHQISFTYHNGKFAPISVPQAKSTSAACISKRSDLIVGGYVVAGSNALRGFTFRHGIYRTLQVPSGKPTVPQCGNDHGSVVGISTRSVNSTSTSGFLFKPGLGSTSTASVTTPAIRAENPLRMGGRF